MKLNQEKLNFLQEEYGNAFYLLDSKQFIANFNELKNSFTSIYPNFNIAYSYKTNYIPKLCKIVNDLGGIAEVVSEMEMEIALRLGVAPENIIWNGPVKNSNKLKELLVKGGTVNLDSISELSTIKEVSIEYPEVTLNVGVRCNFDIEDNVVSRFGFDVLSDEFNYVVNTLKSINNVKIINLQCHFATRRLETWKKRANGMINILEKLDFIPERIDLGGGLFGKMDETLKAQFDSYIPSYDDYANEVAPLFSKYFDNKEKKPMLLIEPGSALVGDSMKFASTVMSIKNIRGKSIATMLGSIYNINPTLNTKNPPIQVFSMGKQQIHYDDLDFGGFTCIESDYMYKHYNGKLAVGDIVVFGNVGSYSIVLKPPFILPNFPVLDICNGEVEVIKRKECFDDIFQTYSF